MIQFHQLAAFDAVIRTGGVTRAAELLGVTQPSISRQLQELQRSFGTKLVERWGRGIRPTRAGELLGDYTKRIFALVSEAERAVHDLQQLRRGRLAVGAGTTLGVYLLPEALVRFRQRFPGISLEMESGSSRRLGALLLDGAIDFAMTETLLPSPAFESTVYSQHELVAIVPAGHRLSSRKSIEAAELACEPFIAREPSSGTRSLVERTLAERGVRITPVVSLSSTEAVKRAVMAGLGVSIVSRIAVGLEAASAQLVTLKIKRLHLRRPVYLVHRPGAGRSKAEIAFLCILKHVIRGTLPPMKLRLGSV